MTPASPPARPSALAGLSGKVLLLTIVFVMLGEVMIFLPSIANFRIQWLKSHIAQSEIAVLAAQAAPGQIVDSELRSTILRGAGVVAVSLMRENTKELVLRDVNEAMVQQAYDLRSGNYWPTIPDAFAVMFRQTDRLISVMDKPPAMTGQSIEIALHEWPLREAMIAFGLRILGLSIVLSLIVAGFIFAALNSVLVKPMQRLSANMMAFGDMPEDPKRLIMPSTRRDEIGIAERELATMQAQLQNSLQQKSHLAALGLAVAKVSHDLRNMLTSAQLISDRLGGVKDPNVQRFAPKLISSLDRAISFLNETLVYGRAQETAPRREKLKLRNVVAETLDAQDDKTITLLNNVDPKMSIDADADHLSRILTNLVRNAVQAIAAQGKPGGTLRIEGHREHTATRVCVMDTGPGIPVAMRGKLFEAFQTAARPGGTGLGLAIAAELVGKHGGTIHVQDSDESGTCVEFVIPDRAAEVSPRVAARSVVG